MRWLAQTDLVNLSRDRDDGGPSPVTIFPGACSVLMGQTVRTSFEPLFYMKLRVPKDYYSRIIPLTFLSCVQQSGHLHFFVSANYTKTCRANRDCAFLVVLQLATCLLPNFVANH